MAWGQKTKTADGEPKKAPTVAAFDRACALLGRREYSKHGLIQALIQRDYTEEAATLAVDRLVASGFQSDERFAQALVRQKITRGQGAQRLNHEIRQHHLDPDLIADVLDKENPDWMEEGQKTLQRKYGVGPYDLAVRRKAFAFLLRRGFSMDIATKLTSDRRLSEDD